VLRQAVANLAALRRHIGEASRRQQGRRSEQPERMPAMDHGSIRFVA